MNDDDRGDEVLERRFDWSLREVTGGERAPDVTEAVLARAAAGERVDDPTAHSLPRVRWLAFAAVFLLGVLTVLGVALAKHGGGGGGDGDASGPRDEAQGVGKPREVTRIEEIASLPVDLQAIEVRNLGDDAVAALVARCPNLEHLRVFASTAYQRADDAPAQSITDAALPTIAKLDKLRQLELLGTVLVKGSGLKNLTALSRIESLALEFFDVADEDLAFLDRLPSLRDLSLTHNEMLGNGAWEAIGRCAGLRQLSVTGGRGVDASSLAPLRNLVHLESLCLFGVGTWSRGVANQKLLARVGKQFGFGTDVKPRTSGAGITVAMLADWPKLRELDLRGAPDLEPTVGAFLRDHCPRLRWLRLDGCPRIDDGTIAAVLALPSLTKIELATCPSLTPDVVPKLAAANQLATVDFGDLAWVTLAHVEQLMAAGKDVTFLHQREEGFRRAVEQLRQRFQHLFTRPNPGLVRTLAELEDLMWNTQRVDVRELGDRAAARLAQFPFLRQVSFARDDDDAFTAKGLRAVAALPRLEQLELNNLLHLEAGALAELRPCVTLRSLDVVNCPIDDAGMQVLPGLPALTTLSLLGVRSFGDDGARAIGKCTSLRSLDLSHCEQLSRDAIAAAGALVDLETLVLADLPKLNDSALMGLQKLTRLRKLAMANGHFTSMGLQTLTDMRQLAWLDVSGNGELVPSALVHVPVGVQTLKLARCAGLDANAATLLRDRFPKLTELDVGQNDWVTDDVLRTLVDCASLQRLDLLRCIKLTNASFATIRDARSLRWVRITGTACATKEQQAQLREERPELEVVFFVW